MGKGRAECSVDGKRVDTFDDVHYKAPIGKFFAFRFSNFSNVLGKCYSVLAKDCTNEQPQFAVMMKTIGDNQDKVSALFLFSKSLLEANFLSSNNFCSFGCGKDLDKTKISTKMKI